MKSVKNLDWEKLREEILRQESFVDECGDEYKQTCLGKVSDHTPSGKHRDFGRPARNLIDEGSYIGYVRAPELLTRPPNKIEQEDSKWWTHLIAEGKKHGIYIRPSSDKDRAFIMAGIKIKDRSET